jgi:hypothetical protein
LTDEEQLLLTRVWQKWRFSAPQTHLWLIKLWFSASTFMVKIATFAKPENVSSNYSMPNNITKTLKLNKKNFDHIQGRKFFYSPQMCWLTFIVQTLVLLLYIYFLFTDSNLTVLWIVGLLIFLYLPIHMFHKLIYKNPIFIINRNQLYYTKTEKYYDLIKCDLDEAFVGKYNFSMTLKLTDHATKETIRENFWYIEYDGELRTILKPYYKDK